MLVTGQVIPWWHMVVWMCIVSVIGVLLAFPMKRRFINDEQLPFPEGRASGVVLDALYSGAAAAGMYKARLLGWTAVIAGLYQAIVGDGWMRLVQFKILRMDQWAGMQEPWIFHERIDDYYYAAVGKASAYIPTILGTDIRQLGLRLTLDVAMLGVGGLIGIAVATSCLLGSFVNFVILAPIMIQAGDIVARVGPTGNIVPISRAGDRQPVVAVVGRDDDGGGLAGEPVRPPGDLSRPLQAQRRRRTAPTCCATSSCRCGSPASAFRSSARSARGRRMRSSACRGSSRSSACRSSSCWP